MKRKTPFLRLCSAALTVLTLVLITALPVLGTYNEPDNVEVGSIYTESVTAAQSPATGAPITSTGRMVHWLSVSILILIVLLLTVTAAIAAREAVLRHRDSH